MELQACNYFFSSKLFANFNQCVFRISIISPLIHWLSKNIQHKKRHKKYTCFQIQMFSNSKGEKILNFFVLIYLCYNMLNQKRQIKVLISSDCQGRLEQLMSKVQALQTKNKFDIMLLNGDVVNLRSSPYVQGLRSQKYRLPLPLYFIDNSQLSPVLHTTHPNGFEIAPNLHFLGSFGVTQIKSLNVAFFSHNHKWSNKPPISDNITEFLQQCKGKKIDVLMTNEWSNEIQAYSKKQNIVGANYVSTLVSAINPHYHLAAGGKGFYRMPPYVNGLGFQSHFISVAPFEEVPKDKYLFALTIKIGQEQSNHSSNCVENPYKSVQNMEQKGGAAASSLQNRLNNYNKTDKKQKSFNHKNSVIYYQGFPQWARNSDITEFLQRWGQIQKIQTNKELVKGCRVGYARFREAESYSSCLSSSQKVLFHTKRIKFTARAVENRSRHSDCWFCRSKGDGSLIIHEGPYCYISLQKGPMSLYHLQLVPYNHVQSTGRLDIPQRDELQQYIYQLTKGFENQGYLIITYERYIPLSQAINHTLIHLLPIKENGQNLLKKFEKLNQQDHLGFYPQKNQGRKKQYFIRFSIGGDKFLKQIDKKERVQSDFMRMVLAQLLDNQHLANWQNCVRSDDQIDQQKKDMKKFLTQFNIIHQE